MLVTNTTVKLKSVKLVYQGEVKRPVYTEHNRQTTEGQVELKLIKPT